MPEFTIRDEYVAVGGDTVYLWTEHLQPHEWVEDPMDAFRLACFGEEALPSIDKNYRSVISRILTGALRLRGNPRELFKAIYDRRVEISE